jgi:hypothetical protein
LGDHVGLVVVDAASSGSLAGYDDEWSGRVYVTGLCVDRQAHDHDFLRCSLRQIDQIRHYRAACSRRTGWVLLRTIGGALIQPVCQSGAGAKLLEEAGDVVSALPAACRAFEAQHLELAD